jgi:hypothetical protein
MNPLGDYTVHFADPDMFVARFPKNSLINADLDLTPTSMRTDSSNGRTYYRSSFLVAPR